MDAPTTTTTRARSLRLAIFAPDRNMPSETFIQAHIAHLPFDIVPVYGSGWERFGDSGRRLWPARRHLAAILRKTIPSAEKLSLDLSLSSYLRKMRVDAALAEYGTTGAAVLDACTRAGVSLFVHFHGYDASHRPILADFAEAYQRLFARAAGFIAVSTPMQQRLLALGAPCARLHRNPYGVDSHAFSGGNPGEAAPHFVAVGRFVEKKAPYLTLLAFRRVLDACAQARLTFVGTGPLFESSKRLAAGLGLAASVEFLGLQPPERISQVMRSARAFVQHSVEAENGDSEGMPVAIIEAQMTGLPVVSTFHAGIPEVVLDGHTGLLVEEGDVSGMAERMLRLAMDPALAATMGSAGRDHGLREFTLERHIGELAQVIERGAAA